MIGGCIKAPNERIARLERDSQAYRCADRAVVRPTARLIIRLEAETSELRTAVRKLRTGRSTLDEPIPLHGGFHAAFRSLDPATLTEGLIASARYANVAAAARESSKGAVARITGDHYANGAKGAPQPP